MMTRQTFRNDCIILKTIEEIVPKEHLVRKLDAAIDLSFIEDKVENINNISKMKKAKFNLISPFHYNNTKNYNKNSYFLH